METDRSSDIVDWDLDWSINCFLSEFYSWVCPGSSSIVTLSKTTSVPELRYYETRSEIENVLTVFC